MISCINIRCGTRSPIKNASVSGVRQHVNGRSSPTLGCKCISRPLTMLRTNSLIAAFRAAASLGGPALCCATSAVRIEKSLLAERPPTEAVPSSSSSFLGTAKLARSLTRFLPALSLRGLCFSASVALLAVSPPLCASCSKFEEFDGSFCRSTTCGCDPLKYSFGPVSMPPPPQQLQMICGTPVGTDDLVLFCDRLLEAALLQLLRAEFLATSGTAFFGADFGADF
mmetsp:Transcript_10575/g.19475  ORF Transcript_10575/g.19475 Transcript_10575/m.19475 type:complete len:226 (+) Transcript_10575:1125-1802(+)